MQRARGLHIDHHEGRSNQPSVNVAVILLEVVAGMETPCMSVKATALLW